MPTYQNQIQDLATPKQSKKEYRAQFYFSTHENCPNYLSGDPYDYHYDFDDRCHYRDECAGTEQQVVGVDEAVTPQFNSFTLFIKSDSTKKLLFLEPDDGEF